MDGAGRTSGSVGRLGSHRELIPPNLTFRMKGIVSLRPSSFAVCSSFAFKLQPFFGKRELDFTLCRIGENPLIVWIENKGNRYDLERDESVE